MRQGSTKPSDWSPEIWRHFFAGLSREHRLIRYDPRGTGLSDWDVADISLDAWVNDVAAVVDAASLDRFPLLGYSQGCAVSIAYAVQHPERVSHLILYGGFALGASKRAPEESERRKALVTLVRLEWGADNPAIRQMFATRREFSYALLAAVVRKPKLELNSALDRIIAAGLLFRQGTPPHATYLFKHALVQDAAYGTLLREPRRVLHAAIAEILEGQFVEIAENRPEIVARHYTEAGLIEKAAAFWGKAGQRSLERSALIEATEQLARALSQIETLPSTRARRQEQMALQTTLINPLLHTKGFAAPETRAAVERANLLIEHAEKIGEPPEDPFLLFSVIGGYFAANAVAGNIEVCRDVAARFLALAEKQQASAPLMGGHHHVGLSLILVGDIAGGKAHLDQAIALYDPAEQCLLVARYAQDPGVSAFVLRSIASWMLGYPEAALADADHAVKDARALGHAASLMYALALADLTHMLCGNCVASSEDRRELFALADEKGSVFWKAVAQAIEGRHLALTGDPTNSLPMITSARNAFLSTGSNFLAPLDLSLLAGTYAALGKFDDARRYIAEAMTTMEASKEKWFEVEVNRIAGEIALKSPERDAAKAEAYFERALAVARQQQAKSLELRAAMSMARLWRDQGKPQQARELLAPVYGWFTEGFDTRDLKEAKVLLDTLAA